MHVTMGIKKLSLDYCDRIMTETLQLYPMGKTKCEDIRKRESKC